MLEDYASMKIPIHLKVFTFSRIESLQIQEPFSSQEVIGRV